MYLKKVVSDPCHFSALGNDSLLVDEFDKFVAPDLSIRFEMLIGDQPGADFRVGPRAPDGVSSITEVVTEVG